MHPTSKRGCPLRQHGVRRVSLESAQQGLWPYGGWQLDRRAFEFGIEQLLKFAHHDLLGPSIYDQMVVAQQETPALSASAHQRQAHQWRFDQVKAALSVCGPQFSKGHIKVPQAIAPVEHVKLQMALRQHNLARLALSLVHKRCAQGGVALYQELPDTAYTLRVERAIQTAPRLDRVGILKSFVISQGLAQHEALQWAEWKDHFDPKRVRLGHVLSHVMRSSSRKTHRHPGLTPVLQAPHFLPGRPQAQGVLATPR